jgi:1,4-dihydroxy-2-naphthoyl-CoA hydrolase
LNQFISQGPADLVRINQFGDRSIEGVLGIRITAVGPDFVCGEMPVDARTHQPFGLLHGGASIVLAESLGSYASFLVAADRPDARVSGIEVSGSHVWAVRTGGVTGVARPVRLGRSLHFWRIDISDQEGNVCCSAKLTVKVSLGQSATGED